MFVKNSNETQNSFTFGVLNAQPRHVYMFTVGVCMGYTHAPLVFLISWKNIYYTVCTVIHVNIWKEWVSTFVRCLFFNWPWNMLQFTWTVSFKIKGQTWQLKHLVIPRNLVIVELRVCRSTTNLTTFNSSIQPRECSFEKCWGGRKTGAKPARNSCDPPQISTEFTWPPPNPVRNLHDPPPPPPRQNQNTLFKVRI